MTERWKPENLETYFYVGRDFEAYNAIWLEDFPEKTRWKKATASRLRKKPKPCSQIVVKASEFDRRIFHLPESRFKVEQFAKGGTLTVKAGVNGNARTAVIKGAWSTTGEAFGCNKRQVAVLVA